ncbi:hypothetical protein LJC68_10305, partial [Bacteroidales bacterium OttesenSCG-928-B11]|nr:hypothetical protein [Bacteroidales bacterium OttesenSCG-928-B11]
MKITKKTLIISIGIISILSVFLACFAFPDGDPKTESESIPTSYTNVLAAPHLPTEINFADEKVPLEVYWVKERLEKEMIIISYQHSKTIQ